MDINLFDIDSGAGIDRITVVAATGGQRTFKSLGEAATTAVLLNVAGVSTITHLHYDDGEVYEIVHAVVGDLIVTARHTPGGRHAGQTFFRG